MTYNSRLGTAPEEGIKAPCVTATTVDVTLAGLGIYSVDDRILVAAQTDPAENGIYLVQESAWLRSSDMNQSDDMISGMLVADITGSIYSMQFTGSWNPGETDMTVVNLPTSISDVTALINLVTYNEAEIDSLIASREPADTTILKDADIGVSVQAHDDALDSLSGTGTSANKMVYTTGIDTFAEADITAAGRALIDDVDADAQRATLGLVIGTNVQAHDPDTAKTDVAQSFTAPQSGSVATGASLTLSLIAQHQNITLAGNSTLDFTGGSVGQSGCIDVDNTGGHVVSAAANVSISPADLTKLSTAGVYWIGYYRKSASITRVSVSDAVLDGGA